MGQDIGYTESSKAPKWSSNTTADGVNRGPGPYIGYVKSNTDPMRSGRLQVWIPELSSDSSDDASWRTVSYLTPFWGETNGPAGTAKNSYGMWFVPPDVGGRVLCMFVNGDPHRGYWMGCVPDWPNSHMVPGISASLTHNSPAPVVEHVGSPTEGDPSDFVSLSRQPHPVQNQIWTKQGIIQDPDRGPGTSSAYRETPSMVFGISTPGQPVKPPTPTPDPNQTGSGKTTTTESVVTARKGGHTFVMDDGDSSGKNAMVRLRTSAGHMLMMNDTKDFIYLINSKGTAWLEMTSQGDIFVYNESNMKITAKAGFNLETDGELYLHAKKDINIKSDANINLEGKDININASGSAKVTGKKELHLKGEKTYLTGDSCLQIKSNGHIDLRGTCTTLNTGQASPAKPAGSAKAPQKMPTKEPYNRGGGASTPVSSPGAAENRSSSNQPPTDAVAGAQVDNKGVVLQDGSVVYPQDSGTQATPNPQAQPSYNATAGMPSGASGIWGLIGGFGNPNSPIHGYGPLTNNIGPMAFNAGMQGSYGGQSNDYASYVPSLGGSLGSVAGTVAGVVAGVATFNAITGGGSGTTSKSNNVDGSNYIYGSGQSYTVGSSLQNITYGTGAAVVIDTTSGTIDIDNPEQYTQGERQNNPGNLQYDTNDRWAIGFANNIAVYASPQEGIAALMNLFDSYAGGQAITSAQLISTYLQTTTKDNAVASFARLVQHITGIGPGDYVMLGDAKTRIAWASATIQYIQDRIIYSYDQVLLGCALSVNMDALDYARLVQSNTQPWQNGYGVNGGGLTNTGNNGGFVSPTNPQLQSGGSSLLNQIGGIAAGVVVGGAVSKYVSDLFNGGSSQPASGSFGFADSGSGSSSASSYGGYSGIPSSTSSSAISGASTYYSTNGTGATIDGGILQNGVSYGNQECAAVAQATIPNFGTMNTIQQGDQVLGNQNLQPGTIITTFNFTNSSGQPAYAPDGSGGVSGQSHTAIYLGQSYDSNGQPNGIIVQDQWAGHPCGVRTIYDNGNPEGAANFYVAKSQANGYDPAGVRVPGSDGYTASQGNQYNPESTGTGESLPPVNATPYADSANPAGGAPTVDPNNPYYGSPATYADSGLTYGGYNGLDATGTLTIGSSNQYGGYSGIPASVDVSNQVNNGVPSFGDSTYVGTTPELTGTSYYDPLTGTSTIGSSFIPQPTASVDMGYTNIGSLQGAGTTMGFGDYYPLNDTSTSLTSYGRQDMPIADYSPLASTGRQDMPIADYSPLASTGRQNMPIDTQYARDGYQMVSPTDQFAGGTTQPGFTYSSDGTVTPVQDTSSYNYAGSELADHTTSPLSTTYNPLTGQNESVSAPLTTTYNPITGQTQVVGGGPITGQPQAPGTSGAATNGGQTTPKGTAATSPKAASC
jgi:hypothetical protein